MTTHISSVVFGSKKFFKHQFTKKEFVQDHQSWKELFLAVRNKQVLISGRKDAAAGNFVFTYQPDTNDLHMTSLSGKVVTFSNVVFPYGQEQINQTVLRQRKCKDKKRTASLFLGLSKITVTIILLNVYLMSKKKY